jgi:hypothetical protein
MCNFYTLATEMKADPRGFVLTIYYLFRALLTKKLVYLEVEEKGEIFDCGELLSELLRELADILQACENRPPGINQEHLHLNLVFRGAGHLLLGLVVFGPGPCRQQRELLQN